MLLCLFEQAGSKPDAVSLGDENDFAIAVNHQYQRQVSCIRQVQLFAEAFCQLLVVVYLKRQVFRERAEIQERLVGVSDPCYRQDVGKRNECNNPLQISFLYLTY